jgi:activator of HSP90 ATPase
MAAQDLSLEFNYLVPARVIYETITNPMYLYLLLFIRTIMQFSQSPAVSEARAGGKLSMYADNIQGEYVSLDENKQIQLKWKMRDWEDYSDVTISFEEDDGVLPFLIYFAIGSKS